MDCSSVLRYYEGSDSCRRHLDGRSPRFSRDTFPTFRLQPRDAPRHRFPRQFQRAGRVSDFALNEQARRYIPPNRVRFTTDRQFASSCSPPRLSTTQLPSASGSWLAPTRTYTVLCVRLHGRTRCEFIRIINRLHANEFAPTSVTQPIEISQHSTPTAFFRILISAQSDAARAG